MILKNFTVTNYKSVENSNLVDVEPITCLVGKNESGKTSILEALTKLNPLTDQHKTFELEEYPRRKLNEYKRVHENKPDQAVNTILELSKDELEDVEKNFGKGILKNNKISISKKYDNKIYYGW